MKLTKSQEQLLALAREPVPRGCQLCLVNIHGPASGVTTALHRIRDDSSAASRQVLIEAPRAWDAVMGLVHEAEGRCYGVGYLDTIWRALDSLSGRAREPLTIWMEDTHHERPANREMLVCLIEWAADSLGVDVRIVMLGSQVLVWDQEQRRRVKKFRQSERLAARARRFEFTREGLDEVSAEGLELLETAQPGWAVKIA
jgi:hypothetical protein